MRGVLSIVALVALVGCEGESNTLLVDLRTDFAAGVEFVAARAEVLDGAGAVIRTDERTALATTDFAAGARVADIDGLAEGETDLRVTLLDGRGDVVADKTTRVLVRGRVAVTMVIGRGCGGAGCPTCTRDADCVPAASCARGQCTDEVCLFVAVPGACDPPLYCQPMLGCVAPPGTDGGVTDASAPDASMPPDAGVACAPECPADEACVSGLCVSCGAVGEACCPGDACDPDRVCTGGTCTSCGGEGEPCCAGGSCGTDRVCDGVTCHDCGSIGEACCAGDRCDPDRICSGGTCTSCGANGEPCCDGDLCGAGRVCAAGVCRNCGALAEPCCDGMLCDPSRTCDATNHCVACGRAGEPCCPGPMCAPGFGCQRATMLCAPCGAPGEECCPGPTCDPPLTCSGLGRCM